MRKISKLQIVYLAKGAIEYNFVKILIPILFEKLFSIINLQAPVPDLYVYLHLPVEKLLENIKSRGREYEKHIKYSYLKEVQEGYFGFFKSQQEMKIVVIDTSRLDFVNNKSHLLQLKKVIFEGEYSIGMNRLIL